MPQTEIVATVLFFRTGEASGAPRTFLHHVHQWHEWVCGRDCRSRPQNGGSASPPQHVLWITPFNLWIVLVTDQPNPSSVPGLSRGSTGSRLNHANHVKRGFGKYAHAAPGVSCDTSFEADRPFRYESIWRECEVANASGGRTVAVSKFG